MVTGTIIGLLGRADMSGIFHVERYVYAGYNQDTKVPKDVNPFNKPRSLFDAQALRRDDRKLVLLASGLEIGMP